MPRDGFIQVAHETGFFDQTHFTKQFKQPFFVTSASYRKIVHINLLFCQPFQTQVLDVTEHC